MSFTASDIISFKFYVDVKGVRKKTKSKENVFGSEKVSRKKGKNEVNG